MKIRAANVSDWKTIDELYQLAHYKFDLPKLSDMKGLYVVEDSGQIVAAAGFERVAHVIGLLNHRWGTPHQRLDAIRYLHTPLAEAVLDDGVTSAIAFADPRWPKFIVRLQQLGWSEKQWRAVEIKREEIEAKLIEARKCA